MAIASGAALLSCWRSWPSCSSTSSATASSHLSLAFLTKAPREGMTAGGVFPAIVGMVEMVFLMTIAGVPVGVATAIYLHEYARRSRR